MIWTKASCDKATQNLFIDEYNPLNIYTEETSIEDIVDQFFAQKQWQILPW